MTVTINGSGPVTGSDRAALGINADITALTALASVNGGQLAGLRNRIINGDMRISQRGSVAVSTAAIAYTLDRWIMSTAGATVTVSQSTDVSITGYPLSNYLKIAGATSFSGFVLVQRIEAANSRDLAGKNVTISFWAYQSSGSSQTVGVQPYYAASGSDNFATTTSAAAQQTQSIPTSTWTRVSKTFALPTAATTGIEIDISGNFALAAGQEFGLAYVQLEIGSVATTFEQRPYGLELALCQRYYEVIDYHVVSMNAVTGNDCYTFIPFKVTKRVTPTTVAASDISNNGFPGGAPTLLAYINGLRAVKTANGNFPNGFYSLTAIATSEL